MRCLCLQTHALSRSGVGKHLMLEQFSGMSAETITLVLSARKVMQSHGL